MYGKWLEDEIRAYTMYVGGTSVCASFIHHSLSPWKVFSSLAALTQFFLDLILSVEHFHTLILLWETTCRSPHEKKGCSNANENGWYWKMNEMQVTLGTDYAKYLKSSETGIAQDKSTHPNPKMQLQKKSHFAACSSGLWYVRKWLQV